MRKLVQTFLFFSIILLLHNKSNGQSISFSSPVFTWNGNNCEEVSIAIPFTMTLPPTPCPGDWTVQIISANGPVNVQIGSSVNGTFPGNGGTASGTLTAYASSYGNGNLLCGNFNFTIQTFFEDNIPNNCITLDLSNVVSGTPGPCTPYFGCAGIGTEYVEVNSSNYVDPYNFYYGALDYNTLVFDAAGSSGAPYYNPATQTFTPLIPGTFTICYNASSNPGTCGAGAQGPINCCQVFEVSLYNAPPVANDDCNPVSTVAPGASITRNVALNDSPAEPGETNTYTLITNVSPVFGTASMTPAGVLSFTAAANINYAVLNLQYSVCDNGVPSKCDIATVCLTISGAPDPCCPAAVISQGSAVCGGDSVLLSANTYLGATYQWYRNGTLIPGATSSTYLAYQSGNYTCRTNSIDCGLKTSNLITVTIATPIVINSLVNSHEICGQSNGAIQISGLQANASYQLTYVRNDEPMKVINITANAGGIYLLANLREGIYTKIQVRDISDCYSNMLFDTILNACAQLGNYVWNDIDQDGLQDINEVGVAGIAVSLFNQNNILVGTTLTDAYGYYKFTSIAPGSYHLNFTLPANYAFSIQNAGNDEFDSDVDIVSGTTDIYVIVAGDSNMSIDAGIHFQDVATASVGNFVWLDIDQNGIQDPGEVGISGVTVSLYDQAGNIVATMLTDADGYYLFTNVLPGVYSVGFSTPPALAFTSQSGTLSNTLNSDANPLTGITGTFTVLPGEHVSYVDAGMYSIGTNNPLLGGLGDKVWNDINQNGLQDSNEPGVNGVTVTLFQSDGVTVIASTQTDAFGNYIFNLLPAGQYIVGFSNLPNGYSFTTANMGTDSMLNSDANANTGKTSLIMLAAGQYNMSYDAGIYNSSPQNTNSIGDFVWNDLNKDGIQNPNEEGVAGVTVTLYDAANLVIAITSTNANGYYLFPDLPDGNYYVGFSNLPVGYIFSPAGQGTPATNSDADPSNGLTAAVSLTGNTHIIDLDAGINIGDTRLGKGSLGDKVWYDLDGDGLQDTDEIGVPGISVTLYAADGVTVLATTTTNALGEYIFTGLDPDAYIVGFGNLPQGFTVSPKNADNEGIAGEFNSDVNIATLKSDIVILGIGEDKLFVDMGIVPAPNTAALGNFVWYDLNNDGLQTAGEPGVQGIMVQLIDNTGSVMATTTTNANGEYGFVGLQPGSYHVLFSNLPAGYTFATANADGQGVNGALNSDADAQTGATQSVTLTAGMLNQNLDAGIRSISVASVGDFVWFDENQNGLQDPSESGIGGVLVTLYGANGIPVASTITNADGSYIFTNVLPGTYTMGFSNIPSGLVFTTQEVDPNSNVGSNVIPLTGVTVPFTVVAGTHNPTIDAGLTTPVVASLGNFVWHDVNENGLQDAGEPGVAGVLVTLYAADGTTILATASTDGDGGYSFTNLPAGGYIVGFTHLPAGSTRTQVIGQLNDAQNSDMNAGGKTNLITLMAGEHNPNIDAGIYFGFPLSVHQLQATVAVLESESSCNVNWYTQTEVNTDKFIIEGSADSKSFKAVGEKKAAGNTIGKTYYNFIDEGELVKANDVLYYRIRLKDIDGHETFSNIITARRSSHDGIMVYPTAFDDALYVEYTAESSSSLDISLHDAVGQVVKQRAFEVEQGYNKLIIDGLSQLAAGNYYITIKNWETGERFVVKIQK